MTLDVTPLGTCVRVKYPKNNQRTCMRNVYKCKKNDLHFELIRFLCFFFKKIALRHVGDVGLREYVDLHENMNHLRCLNFWTSWLSGNIGV